LATEIRLPISLQLPHVIPHHTQQQQQQPEQQQQHIIMALFRSTSPRASTTASPDVVIDAIDKVSIRTYTAADYNETIPIWQRGFYELYPYTPLQVLDHNPLAFAIGLASSIALWWMEYYICMYLVLAMTLLFTSIVGRTVGRSVFWLAILLETTQTMRDMQAWSVAGFSHFWVAEYQGHIVGCVGIKGHHTLFKERRVPNTDKQQQYEASVWRLSVHEKARRLGVGKMLMNAAEQWAIDNGYRHVSLVTGNPQSQQFYARLSYEVESLERAKTVIFGARDAPTTTSIGDRFKYAMLIRRLTKRKSILVKHVHQQSTTVSRHCESE
jgi:GNAT superfamily N-acetyltransferase